MSAETQLPPLQLEPESLTTTEALKENAQDFLIGLAVAVQSAEQKNLVHGITQKTVYVATPTNNTGIIKVVESEEGTRYVLIPGVRSGLYSKDPSVEYETIEAVNKATQLKVTVCNKAQAKGKQPKPYEVYVNSIEKAQELEAFASNLRPISMKEYESEYEYQAMMVDAANRTSFAKKVGKLLRRSK